MRPALRHLVKDERRPQQSDYGLDSMSAAYLDWHNHLHGPAFLHAGYRGWI